MKHIETIFPGDFGEKAHGIGCGECQTSCQSACKTSCTIANQNCEQFDALEANTLRKTAGSRVNRPVRESA